MSASVRDRSQKGNTAPLQTGNLSALESFCPFQKKRLIVISRL
jgi:hypothetical protein